MISAVIDICLITSAICITILIIGATFMMIKDIKDDMR